MFFVENSYAQYARGDLNLTFSKRKNASLNQRSVFSLRKCQIPRVFLPLEGIFSEKNFTWLAPYCVVAPIQSKFFLTTTELFIESGNVYIETKRNVDPYIAFLMHPCVVVWRENRDQLVLQQQYVVVVVVCSSSCSMQQLLQFVVVVCSNSSIQQQ